MNEEERIGFLKRLAIAYPVQSSFDKLAKMGPRAIPVFIELLRHEDLSVVWEAIRALKKQIKKHPEYDWKVAVPALIAALDRHSTMHDVAELLVKIGQPAVPALVNCLKPDDNNLCGKAADILGDIGDESAIPALIDALGKEHVTLQMNAAKALMKSGSAAVPALVAALRNENALVRSYASWALADIAEKEGMELKPVKKALEEFAEFVREKGNPEQTASAEREAAGYLINITKAVGRFRAKSHTEDGIILEGEMPKPPSGKKTYRSAARRAFA